MPEESTTPDLAEPVRRYVEACDRRDNLDIDEACAAAERLAQERADG